MSQNINANNLYAKQRYNISGEVSLEVGKNYLKALLILAGADGKVSDEEMYWLLEEQRLLGAPETLLEEIKSYDWSNANLDELLASLHYDFSIEAKNVLIYQVIKMCRADKEYHAKERKAIWKAAEKLQISQDTVLALESLVKMEEELDHLRFALLGTADAPTL